MFSLFNFEAGIHSVILDIHGLNRSQFLRLRMSKTICFSGRNKKNQFIQVINIVFVNEENQLSGKSL